MEWDCQDFGLGMRLQKDVPIKIARHLQQYLTELCARADLDYINIKQDAIFAIHPGGPRIIQKIQEGLCLGSWQVEHSQQTLLRYGNMSSATLPHVFQGVLYDPDVQDKTYIISMAFGPGLDDIWRLAAKRRIDHALSATYPLFAPVDTHYF
jgi:predicted naringenin-chalcone synthase